MTNRELQQRCAYWQKLLRLEDWRVDVRLADSVETDDETAKCRVFQQSKQAVIRIAKPESVDQTGEFYQAFPESYDLEHTLVHELLHIHFDRLFSEDANEHESIMQEQAVDFIARALIGLDRR